MEGRTTEPKITVKAAAELLNVTTKTIQRYLAKGRLTRVKEGTRTLLLLSEIKGSGGAFLMGQGQPRKTSGGTIGTGPIGDTVTLSRDRYEQLLLELGELRKQNQFFMEFKGILLAKEEALHRLERDLDELRTRVHALEALGWEEHMAGCPGASREAPGTRERVTSKTKKPWWQA